MARILWINPVGTAAYDAPIGAELRAEACLHAASTVGERISILVGRRKWIPEMHENVVKYGFADRLASFRVLEMSVDDFQADPEFTQQRILAEAEAAVEHDRADAIILGCTIEFGFYREVQRKIGVPVIDAITAPLRYAEFLATLGADHGWRTSRAGGYESVVPRELAWIPVVEPVLNVDPR